MDPVSVEAIAMAFFAREFFKLILNDTTSFMVARAKALAGDSWISVQRAFQATSTIGSLKQGLNDGSVKNGDFVIVDCRPSQFGPFVRDTLAPVFSTNRRGLMFDFFPDGDPLLRELAVLACNQMGSYTPLGLYPSLKGGDFQGVVWDGDAVTGGMVGFGPMNVTTSYLPALFAERHRDHMLTRAFVGGVVRRLSHDLLRSVGWSEEMAEKLRATGGLYFLDVTGEDSSVSPQVDGERPPMWGALYAEGHVEFESVTVFQENEMISLLGELFEAKGFQLFVDQGPEGANHGWSMFRNQTRVKLGPQFQFGIHRDLEFSTEFVGEHAAFQAETVEIVRAFNSLGNSKGRVTNPDDLDFTFANGEHTLSVLRNGMADRFADPVLCGLRDWHRQRGV